MNRNYPFHHAHINTAGMVGCSKWTEPSRIQRPIFYQPVVPVRFRFLIAALAVTLIGLWAQIPN